MESDLSHAITWVSTSNGGPWKFQFILNEIKSLLYSIQVDFSHILCSGNAMSDALAKQGVDHLTHVVFNLQFFFSLRSVYDETRSKTRTHSMGST